MDIVIFSPSELVVVLRALRGVASANDSFSPAEAALIATIARLHGADVVADRLDPIAPEAVAEALTDAHKRKRAVQLAIVTALVEGPPDPRAEQAVRALAAALDVPERGLDVLHNLASDHPLLARIDMMRRMRPFLSRTIGLPAFFKQMLPKLGLGGDPEIERRFLALSDLPQGTLGRAMFDHYRENGFLPPGHPDGLPERFLFHDVGHVLSGYGVDPYGEIQQAAFQAGFVQKDGFLFLLFGILQFHVGVRVTPVAQPETGFFDTEAVMRAAARGAACRVDFSDDFDFWGHAGEQVHELRTRFGIPAA